MLVERLRFDTLNKWREFNMFDKFYLTPGLLPCLENLDKLENQIWVSSIGLDIYSLQLITVKRLMEWNAVRKIFKGTYLPWKTVFQISVLKLDTTPKVFIFRLTSFLWSMSETKYLFIKFMVRIRGNLYHLLSNRSMPSALKISIWNNMFLPRFEQGIIQPPDRYCVIVFVF